MPKDISHKIIFGPNHPELAIQDIKNSLDNDGISYTIEGDGEEALSLPAITETLKNTTETDHLHYWMHGGVMGGVHYLQYSNDPTRNAEGIPNAFISTQSLIIQGKDIPGIRHVWSCYSGAAKDSVRELGEDKPVIFHSGQKYSTLFPMNSEGNITQAKFSKAFEAKHGRPPNAYEAFEYSMLTSPETVILSELVNGEVASFKGCATKQPIGKEGLKTYLQDKLTEFRQFRQEKLDPAKEEFIPIQETINEIVTDDTLDHYQETALILEAARKNSKHGLEYVEKYLAMGIDPNARLVNGDTALLLASFFGQLKIAKLLLEKGARVDLADNDGTTSLYIVCQNGHTEIAKLLLKKGAEVDLADNFGVTPLYTACQMGRTEIAKLLLEKEVEVDLADNDGTTSLYIACQNGHTEIAKLLLENGADIEKGPYNAFTPLMVAALAGEEKTVKLLLNQPNMNLGYLSKICDAKIAEAFCQKNGIDIPDGYRKLFGKSAAEMAATPEIAQMIEGKIKEITIAKHSGTKSAEKGQSPGR